jgi:hypothetical protein
MSEPKRFNFSATIVHHIDGEKTAAIKYHTEPDGLFVSYEDYARLKAEVERLTKAGDAIVDEFRIYLEQVNFNHTQRTMLWSQMHHPLIERWLAAKEGKQP